jgi:hypothetical protein
MKGPWEVIPSSAEGIPNLRLTFELQACNKGTPHETTPDRLRRRRLFYSLPRHQLCRLCDPPQGQHPLCHGPIFRRRGPDQIQGLWGADQHSKGSYRRHGRDERGAKVAEGAAAGNFGCLTFVLQPLTVSVCFLKRMPDTKCLTSLQNKKRGIKW